MSSRAGARSETSPYAPVLPQASPVALEVAQGVAIERAGEARARAGFPFLHRVGETAGKRGGGDGRDGRRNSCDFWLTRSGATAGTRGDEALDAPIRDRWLRALGGGARRRPRASWSARPTPASRSSSCSTSSRATCSAATPRAFATDARALAVSPRTRSAAARDQRIAPARAPVLLPAADALRRCLPTRTRAVRLFLLNFGRGEHASATPARTARSSAASAGSPSATPRSAARARRRRWHSSPRAATGRPGEAIPA